MMKERLPNILTYLQHRITNAMSEGINSKIQWIKYTARGFRNFENFRTAIYFHCGGLDLSHSPLRNGREITVKLAGQAYSSTLGETCRGQ